jgi:hypothetical protein
MREGKITLKRGWPINVNKIDAGVVNAFIFYVVNYSDEVALLSVPDTLTLTMADEIVRRVRLVHSGPMQFWPQLNLPAMPKP